MFPNARYSRCKNFQNGPGGSARDVNVMKKRLMEIQGVSPCGLAICIKKYLKAKEETYGKL
jgi:hypothetical protein